MRLAERFADLRASGEKALVLFVTAGDQPLVQLPELVAALTEGGADVVEIGLPFSDPFGEGPTIQGSSQRALARGATTAGVLETLGRMRPGAPLVTMGYFNPILRFGTDRFAEALARAGACGSIVQDLSPEEADEWTASCRARGLETIFIAAPTSPDARLKAVCAATTGFVYALSRTGVTGADAELSGAAEELVGRLRALTDLPICVGFGISSPKQVGDVCRFADGAVVGSWLVDLLRRVWKDGRGRAEVVAQVKELKAATRL